MNSKGPLPRARAGVVSILVALTLALVLSAIYQTLSSANDVERYPPPGKMVDVGDHRLHINCVGEGSPAVLSEAGMSGWSIDWSLVQPGIARVTRACSYDRAGYGWSEEGPKPRTSRQVAAALRTLLQRAGVDGRLVLVGHSLGGLDVQFYASSYPEEVAGLVLVDSVHKEQSRRMAPQVRDAYEGNLKRLTLLASVLAPTGLLRLVGTPASIIVEKLPDANRPVARALSLQSKAYRTLAAEMASFTESQVEVQQAGPLPNVPLSVISSGLVRDFPVGFSEGYMKDIWDGLQGDLATRSPNSARIIVPRSGHYVHLDQPDLVVQTIESVIEESRQSVHR